jgi:RIP homotypic interaction motif
MTPPWQRSAAGNADLVAAAETFMNLIGQGNARSGKYNVKIDGSRGVQVGDGNFQYNSFGDE